jgi:sugar lactone lactonase YvrE
MVLDKDGHLLICQQGQGDKPGYIQRVDVKTLNTSIVADNWFGVPFNSPNDVVVKSDGTIWFTDPIYARYITSSRNSQMHLHDGNCSSLPKHSHHVNCCKTISS